MLNIPEDTTQPKGKGIMMRNSDIKIQGISAQSIGKSSSIPDYAAEILHPTQIKFQISSADLETLKQIEL